MMSPSLIRQRRIIFQRRHPFNADIMRDARSQPSHDFLRNPASHNVYIYLTQHIKSLSEHVLARPFSSLSVLDWGCGKGFITKLVKDMNPRRVDSCDVACNEADSAFGQPTPLIQAYNIQVTPLHHEYILPYDDSSFDVVISMGVLEHVGDDMRSLCEITRVLRPQGLFFCFFLPAAGSWTQWLSRRVGNHYHDRLYTVSRVFRLAQAANLNVLDVWHRALLPKNRVRYYPYYYFELLDQFLTEHSWLKYLATNIEFVGQKA